MSNHIAEYIVLLVIVLGGGALLFSIAVALISLVSEYIARRKDEI
jgi:hypothetical protein